MRALVVKAISFMQQNLHDVVRLPIDMACLNSSLVEKLATAVPISQLATLRDKKDKLESRIYMKKVEYLIKNSETNV